MKIRIVTLRFAAVTVGAVLAAAATATAQSPPGMQGPRARNAAPVPTGGYNEYRGPGWNGQAGGKPGHGKFTADIARAQLGNYGFTSVERLERQHGWAADAVRDGKQVRVFLDDKNEVATYRGAK